MTTPSISDLSALREVAEKAEWLIKKGGYFYRPNKSGYTTIKFEAGRYTEADARKEAEIEPWHMFALHQDEVPDDPTSAKHEGVVSELRSLLAAEKARADAAEAGREESAESSCRTSRNLGRMPPPCPRQSLSRTPAEQSRQEDNPMVGKHPYHAAGLSTAEIIAEAREFLEEELAQYLYPEYDADCEIDCQRSHGYIGALIERLSTAEATIASLTEQLAEARKTIDNAAYLMRLISEWPTASHELTYTNYRGETSVRVLHLVRLWMGATHWHPEPQLLLKAFDNQKDAYRDFAVKDFDIPDARATLSRLEKQEGEA